VSVGKNVIGSVVAVGTTMEGLLVSSSREIFGEKDGASVGDNVIGPPSAETAP
jgi:hypothetical protein